LSLKIYRGQLSHQNPMCTKCGVHTFSLYFGGRKDKIVNMYFCKRCITIYKLPKRKENDHTYFNEDTISNATNGYKKQQGDSRND